MELTFLSLTNYRSYRSLDLRLDKGLTLLHGGNAQGKSNLLEAVYLLAIGKSYRAPSERDLVSWEAAEAGGYAIAAATVERADGRYELRVGLDCANAHAGYSSPSADSDRSPDLLQSDSAGQPSASRHSGASRNGAGVQKRVRVNGVAKRTSDLVGVLNAVLFSAEDIDLVFGPPSGRRRYLDVLLSQMSNRYVRALQRYQRVLTQRNSLLRSLKEGRAKEDELHFWDAELCSEGDAILAARQQALQRLSSLAAQAFARLLGTATPFSVEYVGTAPDGEPDGSMKTALERTRVRERAAGITLVGPHRDDLRLGLGGIEMMRHASRGQARLAALALRLAEGELLRERRGDAPVLLLDDILSELDEQRRALVLEEACRYPQALVTTADVSLVPPERLGGARRLRIEAGEVLEEALA